MPIPKGIAWLHIRKAGTSFVNSLIHHKDLCPNWPADAILTDPNAKRFWKKYPLTELCPGGFSMTFESPPGCAGIGRTFDQNEGKVMGFFRKPEQRMISEFYMHVPKSWVDIPAVFLQKWMGCTAKSLTRQHEFLVPRWVYPSGPFPLEPCGDTPEANVEESALAVERVKRLAFIGLTEEWSLSICLFHAMYGGPCKRLEQINSRPGTRRNETKLVKTTTTYNETAHLGGWKDHIDGPVYDAAEVVFWKRIKEWGVTEERCNRCFAEAM